MKFLVIVSVFVFLAVGAQCCFKEEFEACKQKVGATSEELQALKSGAYGDDVKENIKCLTKCVFETKGFMKDGALKEDVIKQKLEAEIGEENLRKLLDKCGGQVGKTECDTAFKIFTCIMEYREVFEHIGDQ